MLTISPVKSKKELIEFIKFPIRLYKDNPFYVPPLIGFEQSTLDKKKNPAFEHCEAECWIAKRDGKIVGRIAGIILNQELDEKKLARFGWIDFIDDQSVSKLLLQTVSDWAKTKGATGIHGPMGFTDLDFEGALIEGFEQTATQATIYNDAYYPKHYEDLGLTKAVDWIENRGKIPSEVPKKLQKVASICRTRLQLRSVSFKKKKDLLKYAESVFTLLNKSYQDLYGYYPLSPKQVDYYIKQYFGFVRTDLVSVVVNQKDEVVAMAISLPSISEALKKAKGSLFPFGFIHILRSFRSNELMDLFLIGVHPEYQKLGAHAIIFEDLINNYNRLGVKSFATGPMLEGNAGVQNLWSDFNAEVIGKLRRRCFIKSI